MSDYIPITVPDATSGLRGSWWRQPPHVIKRDSYAPDRGPGLRPVPIKGEVLACTGKRIDRYDPMAEAELLNALLDVAQDKLKPVEFANRFGLLGYNYLVPEANQCKGGDPLNWFIAQANTIYTAAELIARLQEAQESTGGRVHLTNFLREEMIDGPYALGGHVVRIPKQGRFPNPILAANGIVRYLLNENIGDTGRRLSTTLRTVFTFRALVQVVYWQLADQIGKSSIHRCVECGRIFSHSNTRKRHCSDRCKNRRNVRELRKRRRKKNEGQSNRAAKSRRVAEGPRRPRRVSTR